MSDYALDPSAYTDYAALTYPPVFAAEALGVSQQTLKAIEREHDLKISRIPRGSVEVRSYTLNDLFQIARVRREHRQTKPFSRPIVITTYVPKGGTGKTTKTTNLAIQLALAGFRTLAIDNDPQADMTTMFGYDPDLTPDELAEMGIPLERGVSGHIGNLLRFDRTHNFYEPLTLEQVVKKPFGEYGPHLVPAEQAMDDMDALLRSVHGSDFRYQKFFENALAGKLAHADLTQYDVILIDNAPATSLLSSNALAAADFVICPIRMDKFSFRSLARLAHKINAFAADFGRSPEIIAIPTMFVRNRPRNEKNIKIVMDLFPGKVTEAKLFHSEDYSKSLEEGIPLSLWRQAGEPSIGAMRQVFNETYARIRAVMEQVK